MGSRRARTPKPDRTRSARSCLHTSANEVRRAGVEARPCRPSPGRRSQRSPSPVTLNAASDPAGPCLQWLPSTQCRQAHPVNPEGLAQPTRSRPGTMRRCHTRVAVCLAASPEAALRNSIRCPCHPCRWPIRCQAGSVEGAALTTRLRRRAAPGCRRLRGSAAWARPCSGPVPPRRRPASALRAGCRVRGRDATMTSSRRRHRRPA